MSAHTPGPWRVEPSDLWGNARVYGPDEERRCDNQICSMAWIGGESEHDARLIAAAPDLLEALYALELWARQNTSDNGSEQLCERARAAIAKATGGDR